jgi:hypothetical protein
MSAKEWDRQQLSHREFQVRDQSLSFHGREQSLLQEVSTLPNDELIHRIECLSKVDTIDP